ncbi:MAG: hypothetical protein JXB07_11110 [Anaerolineae bacterium]|nr:hypothetical protein [Anaerolineae bacterium]
MLSGKLIVLSGLDGAGKSTQIDLLLDELRAQGKNGRYLWTRGGYTGLFEMLKRMIRRLSGKRIIPDSGPSRQRTQTFHHPLVRRAWLILAILDLIRVYGLQVRWWRRRGKIVICDRYIWDTLVDFRLNFPQENVETWLLWRVLQWVTPRPDVAFLILIPVEESVRRSDRKGEPYRDTPEVLSRRLAQYEQLSQGGYWQVLNGQHPVDELARNIRQEVEI